jgi:hypothetical protein
MTTYRSTHIPPSPSHWPFLAATITALLISMGAVLLSAPGLMFAAWLPLCWFAAQLVRCLSWGAQYGEQVNR